MTTSPELVVAIDVGGTRLKGALVDAAAHRFHEETRSTPRDQGPDAVVDAIVAFATELAERGRRAGGTVSGAGVVVPGLVDESKGVAILSANLGWRDLPLRSMIESRLALPLGFGQDVRAGGLAEFRLGAARGTVTALFVPVGTGIGAAMVVDGHLVSSGGLAGEIGHVAVDPAGASCGCGRRGCLETVASAAAVMRRYAERTGRAASGGGEIAHLAVSGDPVARMVWDEAVDALAAGLATCTTLLAPEVIVLGGGLAESGGLLLDPLRGALDARLTFERRPRLARAELGDRAGALGAALLAWERLR
ncbi:ROK family protein [Streptomyces sp. NPDC001530]|uniref:ROK family protein n=1 Tax=Streptomyces sp. NPDC001530 TaxID=3364582 RepID=UPI003673F22F